MYQYNYFVYIILKERNIVCIFWLVSNNISHNCSDKIISSAATVEGEVLVIIIAVAAEWFSTQSSAYNICQRKSQ